MNIDKLQRQFSLPGQVSFEELHPGFAVIQVVNDYAKASISLYGGQLLHFQPHGQTQPLIWLSESAIFKPGKAIRGGVPVCWPWFGDNSHHPMQPAHGFARITFWQVLAIQGLPDGTTQIDLQMPCESNCQNYQSLDTGFNARLGIRFIIGGHLQIELVSSNFSQQPLTITQALHSYLQISSIENVTVAGLDQVHYLDKLADNQNEIQQGDLQISQEVDRIYLDSPQSVNLLDPGLNRQIVVTKSVTENNGSSTVIWNPWKEKSRTMSDMTDYGWRSMLCIESANAAANAISVKPGQKSRLSTRISVEDL